MAGHDHGHEGHGHGHHGPDVKTPLVVAAVFVVAFVAGGLYLVQAGTAARAQAHPGEHGSAIQAQPLPHHQPPQPAATRPPAAVQGAIRAAAAQADRVNFVATFHRRQRAMGFDFDARAAGPQQDVVEISWASSEAPADKVESLKNATAFHSEARGRGFKKIVLRAAGKTIWEQPL